MPADAFYEWRVVEGGKQPYAIARWHGGAMALVGLWEGFRWPDGNVTHSFTIITTDASPDVAELHDRMPVILELDDWPVWLGDAPGDPASLLHPLPAGTLRVWQVDRRVNSPKNNGPELLKPVAGIVEQSMLPAPVFQPSQSYQWSHWPRQ
jgi:putative SOS response-associated peptidase YedK